MRILQKKTHQKKFFTLLVVSNSRGKTWRYVVSTRTVKTIAGVFCLFLFIGLAAAVDYTGLLVQSTDNKRLRAENLQLTKEFQVVDSKLNGLEVNLERVKSFAQKLRLITNTGSTNRLMKLAIGPMPKIGQAQADPIEEREPASDLAHQDSVFFQHSEPDAEDGELSSYDTRDYASISIRIDQDLKRTQLQEQGVLDLLGALSDKQDLLNSTPDIQPVQGWYSSGFGYRLSPFTHIPAMHDGLDIAAPFGSPVIAPADGVVKFAGYENGFGNLVEIDHGYGVVTFFGHNSRILVKVGQRVKRGDIISAVGTTGRSTGPHLHYEIQVNGVPVDPINYIL